jgi:hypothetical protein|tara:strand:+ start:122 stop:820 length:699 start_codon:yes stop_codon:yes gene_type:complete
MNFKYVPFVADRFDYDYCRTHPYRNQLEAHPIANEDDMALLHEHLTDWEKAIIIAGSYYFIWDSYDQKRITEQSDKLISIEDCQFSSDVHANSTSLIKEYVETYQGTFSFLMGNNDYRPKSDSYFKHAHQPTEIDGKTYEDTFTIIYPIHLENDVIEEFKIFYVEEEGIYKLLKAPLTYPEGDVKSIRFPKKGEALLIHFNSCKGIHWIDGLTNNNFMAHAFDSVNMRKELC